MVLQPEGGRASRRDAGSSACGANGAERPRHNVFDRRLRQPVLKKGQDATAHRQMSQRRSDSDIGDLTGSAKVFKVVLSRARGVSLSGGSTVSYPTEERLARSGPVDAGASSLLPLPYSSSRPVPNDVVDDARATLLPAAFAAWGHLLLACG